jgi:DnaJ-class molecular chaperone
MPMVTCTSCDGTGKYINQFGKEVTCFTCGGSGKVHHTDQPPKKK